MQKESEVLQAFLRREHVENHEHEHNYWENEDYSSCSRRTTHREDPKERDQFNNHFEYLLSVLGLSAGFGSVWRFPYLVYKNGGGVFLIPYFIFLFLIGIPSFYFETSLGQILQKSPPLCFEKTHKKWKGLGLFGILLTLNTSTYYNLILAYSIYYLWESLQYPLPWKIEDALNSKEPWNTKYFYEDVLHVSSGLGELGDMVWSLAFCYVISQFFVYICIKNGVTVSGKISVVTAISPYVLLLLLMMRGLFLEGAMKGLQYLFAPDWSKLFLAEVWVDAANQVIFQVSSGCGILILFGSYRPKSQEIIKTSYYIPLITVLCGLLASVVIFSFMGFMSHVTGISINDMPLRGPDLAFIVFPAVLSLIPFSNVFSFAFFLIMIFLGIDTQFGQVDTLAGTIEDEFKGESSLKIWKLNIPITVVRPGVCGVICFSAFLFCSQAGFLYLDFVDNYSTSINLFVCVLTESYFFFFVENWQRIEGDIIAHVGQQTPHYMFVLMKYSLPFFSAALALLALYLQILQIPTQRWWVTLLGWSITLYPYCFIYYYYHKYKKHKLVEKTRNPLHIQELRSIEPTLVP